MSNDVTNVRIEPCDVYWGEDVVQVETITFPSDVSAINNKYFYIYGPSTNYYVWFDVDSGGSDPNLSGYTGIEVDLDATPTAAEAATAAAAAIGGVADFSAAASGAVATMTHAAAGLNSFARDDSSNSTGCTFGITTHGDSSALVGYVDGDIGLSLPEDLAEIVAHQTGTNILSHIRTGHQVGITISFMETSTAQLKKALAGGNASYNQPDGSAGTSLAAIGMDKDFTQTLTLARELKLHPKALAATDYSRDWKFWSAYPILEELTYSGENKKVIPVRFIIYPDTAQSLGLEYGVFGDHTQLS
jgi:hypothetical protein